MPRRPTQAVVTWLAVALLAVVATAALSTGKRAAAADTPPATTPPPSTTLPVDLYPQSVIPLPNSGHKPESPGDPGGSQQVILFWVLFAGSALIFGRVLWAARAHTVANRVETTRNVDTRRARTPRPSG